MNFGIGFLYVSLETSIKHGVLLMAQWAHTSECLSVAIYHVTVTSYSLFHITGVFLYFDQQCT